MHPYVGGGAGAMGCGGYEQRRLARVNVDLCRAILGIGAGKTEFYVSRMHIYVDESQLYSHMKCGIESPPQV